MRDVHLLFIGIPLWIVIFLRVGHVPCPLVLLCAQALLDEERSGKEVGDPGPSQYPLPEADGSCRICYTGEEIELQELKDPVAQLAMPPPSWPSWREPLFLKIYLMFHLCV